MIIENKIQTKKRLNTSKVWYGNPQIELTEGTITYSRINYFAINKSIESEYNESELEIIKQFIWETNNKNNLITASELCSINIPNKISMNEFLNSISIYLSYINVIRILKSPIPNFYFIYLQFKNKEYANIFYNTFNYAKINPIEKEYYIFVEVKEIKFEEIYKNELSYQNCKKFHGIKALVSPSNKVRSEGSRFQDLNQQSNLILKNSPQEEIIVCSICLDQIDIKDNNSYNNLTSVNGSIYVLCGHVFHIECSLKLDDDKCPLCRYNLSPANISSCSLCSCEDDLWMCLVCGSINCGDEGGSNNHRKEHYIHSGHIYARGLGDSHNITFDFTKMAPLNFWMHTLMPNVDSHNDTEFFKDPKQKVEYIISEYNSIISSQLESQRLYYINLVKKIEESCTAEEFKLDKEIEDLKEELENTNQLNESIACDKNNILELVKKKENEIKTLEKELKDSDFAYKHIVDNKEKFEEFKHKIEVDNKNKLIEIENSTEDLQNQIKDLKIHLKNLSNKNISGASINLLLDTGKKNKKKK